MAETDWEARYRSGDMPWEKGAPSPGLVDFLSTLPTAPRRELVAVPGCGTGHDVRAWGAAGFETHGFDVAPSAIQAGLEKTKGTGLTNVHYHLADFLHDDPPRQFDWLFEHTLFCAIERDQRDRYVESVVRWLKSDGQFLAVHYMIPDEDGPPYGTKRDELMQRFSPHFELLKEWVPRSYPNRTGLELMLWWRKRG